MSSSNSKFSSKAKTGVFWDLDEFPIPDDLSPASIYDNIKLALNNMGYTGRVSIFAYSSANQSKEEFESANIQLQAVGAYKNPMFALDIYNWGVDHPDEPTNLMVISEDVSFLSSLIDLSKKENIVLLVQPQNASGRLLETASETASLVWLWTSLSTGGSPIDNQRGKSKVAIPSPTCSAETGVFWDLDDCPIPDDLTPALIYDNIKVALKNMGYNGKVSIVAYSVANQTKEDFDFVNIKLINPGTSQEKVNTMFKDVYMWGINHREEPTNLMVISKDISQDVDFVSALVDLSKKENNILLAHPQNTSGVLLRTASLVWLWTSLSTGGSPLDNQSSQVATTSPTCSSSKKRSSLSVANKQKKRRTKPLHKKRKSRANPLDNQSSQVATTSPTCSASRKRSSLSVANKQKKRRTKPLHKKGKSRKNPNPED